jgi:PAS domain S-box-containing protein
LFFQYICYRDIFSRLPALLSTNKISMKSNKSHNKSNQVLKPGINTENGAFEPVPYEKDIISLAKLPSENPNPVMRLGLDGTLLYINNAGERFAESWNISAGHKVPENMIRLISGIAKGSHKEIEMECCNKMYSFTVVPILEESYINLYGRDITQQKTVEERLRLQANIMQNISDAIYATDLELRITNWNSAAEKLYGWKEKDVIGKSVNEVTGPRFDQRKQEDFTRKLLEEGYVRTQLEHTSKSGSSVFLDSITIVHKNLEGQIIGYISTIRDITEKVLAEKAFQESEEKYKELVSNAKSIILKMDSQGRFIFVNEFAQDFFGYKEDEIIGKTGFETIVPKTESTGRDLSRLIDNIYENPDKFSVNINENIKKNKERVWIEWHNKAIFDQEGNKSGHIAIGMDITQRKKSEDALQEARDKLNIALENAGIGLWEWDVRTGEVLWDEKLEKMFGLEPGAFGKTFADFENLVHEEDIFHVQNSIKNTLERGKPFETIFRTRPENGVIKYISSKAFVNKKSTGMAIRLSGVCFDITGMQAETERLVIELNEELLRSNKDLESFAYAASHDLQEPLRMVTYFTQLLEKNYKDVLDEKGHEYIHFASDGAKRMYELLNGLLDYSRIHKKGKVFNLVDMNQILDTVKKNLSFIIKEKNAVVKSRKLPVILGDDSQMIQLFQNLISNSIKFSARKPKISISCKTEKDQYIFSLADKGIGIEPQYFERIFQIFQRLHARNKYEGTGIGLAICKRIAEHHGGKIWVKSAYGKGSTFFVSIPKSNTV